MTDPGALLTCETPTSPYLFRLVWLGERLALTVGQLTALFLHGGILADLDEDEYAALRRAAQAARTAGGDVGLVGVRFFLSELVTDRVSAGVGSSLR
jgi:hypothetical protein